VLGFHWALIASCCANDRQFIFSWSILSLRFLVSNSLTLVSVDTKKKELVGDFQPTGREWQPAY
jgi:hypothetical protein